MTKRPLRQKKELSILVGLVEHYIKTGKPVGSGVLQEAEFHSMSSATIRNYFSSLEEEGYVRQVHTSGGRIPLSKAYELYAKNCLEEVEKADLVQHPLSIQPKDGANDIILMLEEAAARISDQLKVAVVLSAPRFDRDSIVDIHFHFIDVRRVLAVILSEFGLVHTEVLMPLEPVSPALVRKADRFAKARLYKEMSDPELYDQGELELIRRLYQEAVSSFFVGYSSFSQEDIWKTGFLHLLSYPELEETSRLGASLALFENSSLERRLIREVMKEGKIQFWIGEKLQPYLSCEPSCVFIAAPYRVGNHSVGGLGILGPERMWYKDVFRLILSTCEEISEVLTNCLMRQRITYRMAETTPLVEEEMKRRALEFCPPKLLENTGCL